MQLAQFLDVIEAVLRASGHPDIDEVRRYGSDAAPGGQSPAGVAVRWKYGTGAMSYLAGSLLKVDTPLPTPQTLPAPTPVAARLPTFVVQLLDVAQPALFRSWELVALVGIGPIDSQAPVPGGVRIIGADGTTMVFHATYGSGQTKEPEEELNPEYAIPEGVKSCLQEVSALPAERG